jgi:hypothetical protein
MAGVDLHIIFMGFLKLALLAGAALYTGLVLLSIRTDDPHLRPRLEWHDPARSAERWLVWLGVKALTLAVRMGMPILGILSEASADVGEWFLSHRHRSANS